MLKDLDYISLDFETTGLDVKKDEAIQIGILKFNNKFEIKDYFCSYINPGKNINELKDIVNFITGIEFSDLENAPNINEITPKIKNFLGEKSVIIGHNVQFDIKILNKYLNTDYFKEIDTFMLAKTLIHFLPNYSLEVITGTIFDKEDIQKEIKKLNLSIKPHDALYDSFSSYMIFKFFFKELYQLLEKYPVLNYFIKKSNSVYKDILQIENTYLPNNLFIPSLKKEVKKETKLFNKKFYNLNKYQKFDKIYTGNIPLEKLIPRLIAGNKKIIMSFSSNAKMQKAKKILTENNIKNIGYLGENYVLDEDNIKKLIEKEKLSENEINFLIKYYSQFDKGHGIIDINSYEDYKIFNFLKKVHSKKNENIILSTHIGLLNSIQKEKDLKGYKILFFDWDFWYNSFLKFINSPIDLYNLINKIEILYYKINFSKDKSQKQTIKNFYKRFLIFIGILFSEINKNFKNTDEKRIEINPIIENIDFYKTNLLWRNFYYHKKELQKSLSEEDFEELSQELQNIEKIINELVLIEKRLIDIKIPNYIFFQRTNVINYQEFLSWLEDKDINFITNFSKEKSYILDEEEKIENKTNIQKIQNLNSLLSTAKKNESVFILSTKKELSKNLFQTFLQKNMNKDYQIIAENISGSIGKNVFYSKINRKKIIIGGYELILKLFAEKINFDIIIVYYTNGPLEKQIINDINYYS